MKLSFLIVLIADNLLPLILSRFYSGYKHMVQPLSVLGSRQSPVKWIYNAWCIVSGVAFCIAPYVLFYKKGGGLLIAILLHLAIYGIGCEIISGIFPLNEKREDEDIITKVHGGASAIGFMALLAVPLLITILQYKSLQIVTGTLSLICFILAFVFFCFFIMGEKEKFRKTVLRYGGLWQRLVLAECYISLFIWTITI